MTFHLSASSELLMEGDLVVPRTRNALACWNNNCLWKKSSNGKVEVPYTVNSQFCKYLLYFLICNIYISKHPHWAMVLNVCCAFQHPLLRGKFKMPWQPSTEKPVFSLLLARLRGTTSALRTEMGEFVDCRVLKMSTSTYTCFLEHSFSLFNVNPTLIILLVTLYVKIQCNDTSEDHY